MACLASLAFVAFAASFEAPSPPPRSLRSPPLHRLWSSLPPVPMLPSCWPLAGTLRLAIWCCLSDSRVRLLCSATSLPLPPACCFGAIWWCPPSVSSKVLQIWCGLRGSMYVPGGRVSTTMCCVELHFRSLMVFDDLCRMFCLVILSRGSFRRECALCALHLLFCRGLQIVAWFTWKYVLRQMCLGS